MKLAVTYKDGQVFQHFGHTEMFKIFDIEDGKIINSSVVFTNGQGHGALAGFLKEQGVTSLICGGIGGGAKNALAEADILVYGGVSGNVDEVANALLSGTLVFNPNVTCSHHSHEDGHSCGSGHSCH